MEASIDKPKENPAAVSEDKRPALNALREKIRAQDPISAGKLGDVEKKSEVLSGLRDLSRMVESGRVTGVTKAEVDAMHDSIEASFLVSTRPVEELAQNALDAARGMNPEVKKAAIAAGVVGGVGLGFLNLRGAGRLAVKAYDGALDIAEKGAKKISQGASFLWKWMKRAAVAVGVGVASTAAWEMFVKPRVMGPEKPKTV